MQPFRTFPAILADSRLGYLLAAASPALTPSGKPAARPAVFRCTLSFAHFGNPSR